MNIYSKGSVACIVAALLSVPAFAAEPTARVATPSSAAKATQKNTARQLPALPGMSAAQVIERNLAASGGAGAWRRVSSMTVSGKLDAGTERKDGGLLADATPMSNAERKMRERLLVTGKVHAQPAKVIQLPFKMELERPNKSRIEVPFQSQTAVQVFDGKQGWKLRPYLGRHEVEPYTADEMKIAAGEQELDGPLVDYARKGTTVKMDGIEAIDGHDAYRLKLTLKNGSTRRLWIDGTTFLEVGMEGAERRLNGRLRPVITYFRDYQPVQGLMVARRLETVVDGIAQREHIVIDQVAVNVNLGAAQFAKPM
jgi:hypothetical protein